MEVEHDTNKAGSILYYPRGVSHVISSSGGANSKKSILLPSGLVSPRPWVQFAHVPEDVLCL